MDLTLAVDVVGDRAVLRVGGDVDIDTVPQLRLRLRDVLDVGARTLLLDLDAVEFIDSTGLGMLVGVLKETEAVGGTLELVCSQPRMLSLLRLTGLDALFTVHDVDPSEHSVSDRAG